MEKSRYRKLKKIYCPVCNSGHIMDESTGPTITHAILYKPDESEGANWFLKCPKCKSQIGVSPDLDR